METEGSPRVRTGGRRRVRNLAEDKSSTCPAHGRFHPSADSHPLVDSCWTCSCRPTPTTRDWRPGPRQPAQAQAHAWKWKLVDSSAAVPFRQVHVCSHPFLPFHPCAWRRRRRRRRCGFLCGGGHWPGGLGSSEATRAALVSLLPLVQVTVAPPDSPPLFLIPPTNNPVDPRESKAIGVKISSARQRAGGGVLIRRGAGFLPPRAPSPSYQSPS